MGGASRQAGRGRQRLDHGELGGRGKQRVPRRAAAPGPCRRGDGRAGTAPRSRPPGPARRTARRGRAPGPTGPAATRIRSIPPGRTGLQERRHEGPEVAAAADRRARPEAGRELAGPAPRPPRAPARNPSSGAHAVGNRRGGTEQDVDGDQAQQQQTRRPAQRRGTSTWASVAPDRAARVGQRRVVGRLGGRARAGRPGRSRPGSARGRARQAGRPGAGPCRANRCRSSIGSPSARSPGAAAPGSASPPAAADPLLAPSSCDRPAEQASSFRLLAGELAWVGRRACSF